MPAPKLYTLTNLADSLGVDRKRVQRVLEAMEIKPSSRRIRNAKAYHVPKAKLDEMKERLQQAGTQANLPLDLKEAKLAEEVEHLKLKNRKLRDEATPNRIVAEILGGLATFTAGLLTQKLEIEWPVQTAGLEPAEIREIARKVNDEIRARYDSEFEKWEKYLDESITISQGSGPTD